MANIILILGAPNDDDGNLSTIARDRLLCAYQIVKYNTDFDIICTGGFGEHFNRTSKPHSDYAKDFLIRKGVNPSDFIEPPLTSNTIEDFAKTKDLVLARKPDLLVVITSDFHMERAKMLYNKYLQYKNVVFVSALSTLAEAELRPLVEHERKAIERLKHI